MYKNNKGNTIFEKKLILNIFQYFWCANKHFKHYIYASKSMHLLIKFKERKSVDLIKL